MSSQQKNIKREQLNGEDTVKYVKQNKQFLEGQDSINKKVKRNNDLLREIAASRDQHYQTESEDAYLYDIQEDKVYCASKKLKVSAVKPVLVDAACQTPYFNYNNNNEKPILNILSQKKQQDIRETFKEFKARINYQEITEFAIEHHHEIDICGMQYYFERLLQDEFGDIEFNKIWLQKYFRLSQNMLQVCLNQIASAYFPNQYQELERINDISTENTLFSSSSSQEDSYSQNSSDPSEGYGVEPVIPADSVFKGFCEEMHERYYSKNDNLNGFYNRITYCEEFGGAFILSLLRNEVIALQMVGYTSQLEELKEDLAKDYDMGDSAFWTEVDDFRGECTLPNIFTALIFIINDELYKSDQEPTSTLKLCYWLIQNVYQNKI